MSFVKSDHWAGAALFFKWASVLVYVAAMLFWLFGKILPERDVDFYCVVWIMIVILIFSLLLDLWSDIFVRGCFSRRIEVERESERRTGRVDETGYDVETEGMNRWGIRLALFAGSVSIWSFGDGWTAAITFFVILGATIALQDMPSRHKKRLSKGVLGVIKWIDAPVACYAQQIFIIFALSWWLSLPVPWEALLQWLRFL